MLAVWGSHLSPEVGRSEILKLYNTKRAKEMRLALVEDRTVPCRIANKSEPLFISSPFVRQNENKRPRYVFPTSEAFALQ